MVIEHADLGLVITCKNKGEFTQKIQSLTDGLRVKLMQHQHSKQKVLSLSVRKRNKWNDKKYVFQMHFSAGLKSTPLRKQ